MLVMCTGNNSNNKEQLIIPAAQKIVKNGRMPWDFWVLEPYIFLCVCHGTNACFFSKKSPLLPISLWQQTGEFLGC